ncbi:MAG: alpha-ketoglutarate decarboxylase [Flavobacteriaceae bacterium]|nr:alpha-ketoglutarate decarboxylase [Flavobacteriaceae bacterium]
MINMPSILLKISILIFICLISSTKLQAQESPATFWQNVRFGGGVGLSFGNGFFSGTLAPSAIYDFNEQFSAGVGLNGTYNKLKATDQNFGYTSTILGGSILTLFNVIPQIRLSGEFEQLYVTRKYDVGTINTFAPVEDDNYWYPALFLGAGYRTNNVTVGIRYDVLYDENQSIYANAWMPFFRVYF